VLKIDMLKGQGIPIKSRPGLAAMMAVSITIPIIIAMTMLGNYVRGSVLMTTQKRFLVNEKKKIENLAVVIASYEHAKEKVDNIKESFIEISDTIRQQTQWSPVLEVIAKVMPETLVLKKFETRKNQLTVKVPDKKKPSRQVTIKLPQRSLFLYLYGKTGAGNDRAVLKFLEDVRSSEILSQKIETIRIVNQNTDTDNDIIHYDLECVFKYL